MSQTELNSGGEVHADGLAIFHEPFVPALSAHMQQAERAHPDALRSSLPGSTAG